MSDILTFSPSDEYNESPELTDQGQQVMLVENVDIFDAHQLNSKSLPMSMPTIPTYIIINSEDGPITLVPLNELQTPFHSNYKQPANKVAIPRLTKENRCDPSVYTIQSEDNVVAASDVSVKQSNVLPKLERKKRTATNKTFRVPASKRVRKLVNKVSNTEYRCILCGLSFPQNYLCEYHVRIHTGEMPFKCVTCDKSFAAMFMLKKHQQSHETSTRHLCKTCGRGFRSVVNLNCHEKMHLDAPAPFKCETCDKPFYFRTSYLGHLETHLKRRDHMCDQCTKTYKTMRHLKEHVARIHEGKTRHTCPTCHKRFYRNTTYKQHLRLHTAERPYSCDICGRAFNERTNWQRHQRVHEKKSFLNNSFIEVEVETVIQSDEVRDQKISRS